MRNILCVRPEDRDWIRLGHYEGLSFDKLPPAPQQQIKGGNSGGGGGGEDGDGAAPDKMDIDSAPDTPTVESVNRLRRRLQASQKLNTMLHAERARNDVLLGELRSLVGRAAGGGGDKGGAVPRTSLAPGAGAKQEPAAEAKPAPLAFLHERGDLTQADASTPLSTTTAFSLSQLQALRALSTSLSNIMPNLREDGGAGVEGGGGVARRTWRKERVEYVEGAARKHLEGVRGLELGQNGDVRDGEWQGEGRRFAGGEVAALEEIVGALEKPGGDGSGGGDEDKSKDEDMVE